MSGEPTPQSIEQRRKEEEDEDRGLIAWFWRWYQRYDKWSGRWDWLNRLLALFKTHTAASIVGTAIAAGAAVVVVSPELRHRWLPSYFAGGQKQEVKVETKRWGSSVVFPIEGKDAAGRSAAFDVAVLPKDLSWVRKSDSQLDQGGTTIPETDAAQRIFTPELRDGLGRSTGLIAIGLASQEGQLAEEAQRAGRRASSAAGWVKAVFDEKTPIWTLNLGQFRGTCKATTEAADTGWQRPLIIVGIRSQEDGVNLGEAFADAISGKTNLPSRDCYTNFDLGRFR
jgi:hypothetical protein